MTRSAVSPITVSAATMSIRPVTITTATPRSVNRQPAVLAFGDGTAGAGIGITHACAAELAGRLRDCLEIG